MPGRWVPQPRKMPNVCANCFKRDEERGPYFEWEVNFFREHGGPECNLYTCTKCLLLAFKQRKSPFNFDYQSEVDAQKEELERLRVENERLIDDNAELERAVDHSEALLARKSRPATTRRSRRGSDE